MRAPRVPEQRLAQNKYAIIFTFVSLIDIGCQLRVLRVESTHPHPLGIGGAAGKLKLEIITRLERLDRALNPVLIVLRRFAR